MSAGIPFPQNGANLGIGPRDIGERTLLPVEYIRNTTTHGLVAAGSDAASLVIPISRGDEIEWAAMGANVNFSASVTLAGLNAMLLNAPGLRLEALPTQGFVSLGVALPAATDLAVPIVSPSRRTKWNDYTSFTDITVSGNFLLTIQVIFSAAFTGNLIYTIFTRFQRRLVGG